jgi:pSer/pThr/pTyr-binding forkhead associated (FHA) protein
MKGTEFMAFLYQIQADGTQVKHWELSAKPLVVGRGECADACVEDDALSQSHFLITSEGSGFCLIDLNSKNGTWVKDARVTAHKLHPNDVIFAGTSLFCFSDVPVTAFTIPGLVFPEAADGLHPPA